jgi:hypothetical protein
LCTTAFLFEEREAGLKVVPPYSSTLNQRYSIENFDATDIMKLAISRNTNIEGDEWKFHTLIYGLICLIQLFFLRSEPISLFFTGRYGATVALEAP